MRVGGEVNRRLKEELFSPLLLNDGIKAALELPQTGASTGGFAEKSSINRENSPGIRE
jgi:hypothetical protein